MISIMTVTTATILTVIGVSVPISEPHAMTVKAALIAIGFSLLLLVGWATGEKRKQKRTAPKDGKEKNL